MMMMILILIVIVIMMIIMIIMIMIMTALDPKAGQPGTIRAHKFLCDPCTAAREGVARSKRNAGGATRLLV